jgi:cell division protease FtsH
VTGVQTCALPISPGTGKTLLAKAIAGEAKVPFYYVGGSDLVDSNEKSGEEKLRQIFTTAKTNAPSIIFFDEIDNFTRSRMEFRMSGTETILQELLVLMDGIGKMEDVLVIGSTNRLSFLDEALLRAGRFDRKIKFERPRQEDRLKIIEYYMKDKTLNSSVNLIELSEMTSGLTGADLESLINEAGLLAIREDRLVLKQEDLLEAMSRNQMGISRTNTTYSEADTKRIAIHEVGHVISTLHLFPNNDMELVSISRRDRAVGYMKKRRDDNKPFTARQEMKNELVVLLSGYSSELILLGDVVDGNSDDLMRATSMAKAMVTTLGMSESRSIRVYLGRHSDDTYASEKHLQFIDDEISLLLDQAYTKAYSIVYENQELIEHLASILVKEKTMTLQEVQEAIRQFNNETNQKVLN